MRLPRFPKAAASASGITSRMLLAAMVLCPGLVLFACAEPSVVDKPTTPDPRSIEKRVQYLSNVQRILEHAKASQEKRLGGLRAMLQIEQDEQKRDRELVARAEAHTPQSMDVSLTHEWDETLTKLRHEMDDRRARSMKNEESAKQLIIDTEELVHQYGILSEQVGEVNEQIKIAVPPSEAFWLERRDAIRTDIQQANERHDEVVKRGNELSDQYRLRGTDSERTRSKAVVTSSIKMLDEITERAKKLAVEQERQQVLLREKEEAQQRGESAEQARRDQEAQQQQAEAVAQATLPECASSGVDGTALSGSAVEHVNRGGQLEASGKLKEAITEYCLAVRISPDYQTARTRLSFALRLAAHDSDAIRQRTELMGHARRAREAREAADALQAEKERPFNELLHRHKATDMSSLNDSHKLYVNPFAYQGKRVFLSGGYHKNIDRQEAIVAILPDRDPTTYIVVWRTSRNLADGSPLVRCVVKVLGTTSVRQGMREREVPHVQEIECLR